MMNNLLKFIIILTSVLLFSCKKHVDPPIAYRLTAEDLTWNIYHVGDTIKFFSNHGNSKQYYIEYMDPHISYPMVLGSEGYSYESIGIGFRRADSLFDNNFFAMGLCRGYPSYGDHFVIMAYWFDDLHLPVQFILPLTPLVDTLTINNTLYHNILTYNNKFNDSIPSTAKKIYYQKQKGWLRIELNSGEIFDRIN